MADRFFPNTMPDFVAAATSLSGDDDGGTVSAPGDSSPAKLLAMPYPVLSESFKRAALDLKETMVVETWGVTRQRVRDFALYTGSLGTAFSLFRSYQITSNSNDLALCSQIIRACDSASSGSRDVTFICGRAGVCALGAVVAKYVGDTRSLTHYVNHFKEIKLSRSTPDELLYGRAGFLWACLFLNKHIGDGTVPSSTMRAVADEIFKNGRALAKRGGKSPLMFEWYGEKYWGAAHGLAGIMHVLMHLELKPDEMEDVKGTLKYMIRNRFPSGNYPSSEEDRNRDVLVHWCHGAPGIALTLVKAAEVFRDDEFLRAAVDAAEVVWNRGLLRRVGICHGISGNAYVFLSLYRVTGNEEFLYRAKAFACFLLDRALKLISTGEMHGGDNPYSLFEGIGGMAYLFLDMVEPSAARFPAYEL
ncbi:lanC-like protein GCL2 [Rhodamnia argentea]|uniref:LanC-like protein GCL2 n=1 Tax=Rhodamnia argentea TaxID=178133 RepID=A0A8B8QGQ4_9MYRT|nr:lanC-like protein GCL2 [Rhodamnia argentea]